MRFGVGRAELVFLTSGAVGTVCVLLPVPHISVLIRPRIRAACSINDFKRSPRSNLRGTITDLLIRNFKTLLSSDLLKSRREAVPPSTRNGAVDRTSHKAVCTTSGDSHDPFAHLFRRGPRGPPPSLTSRPIRAVEGPHREEITRRLSGKAAERHESERVQSNFLPCFPSRAHARPPAPGQVTQGPGVTPQRPLHPASDTAAPGREEPAPLNIHRHSSPTLRVSTA
ncbi:hypothetical protein AAFF_G00263680 [Aldrovandia affinis]|uniref:Uncharacterized protein n=1 Tax=Aldrovandia affinis TaxID=143900 RepID=A0AAD7SSS3_9TELE|nr:hypothetical protein AAFF_G00263680 [Aldrovandia affinis]